MMAFSQAMRASIGTFELLMGLLADLTENLLLKKLDLILRLDQVDLFVLLHTLGGDVVTLLLLNIG